MSKPPIHAVFALRLRAGRVALGITQAELGVRVGLPEDVASTRINRYEKAVHSPDFATAENLAEELGIPLPALMCQDDGMALLIAGFAALSKAKQEAILSQMETALGSRKAEQIRAQLQASTPPASNAQGSKRRL